MSAGPDIEQWFENVTVTCKKCGRNLLRYRRWSDADGEDVIGEDRWEPADAKIVNVGNGAKFVFACRCGARPQVRYETVADAAAAHGRNTMEI